MPFTLSHPAAVLPFLRRPFVPAALVAGAMAPDIPYFIRVPVTAQSWYEPFFNATYSHSYEGLLLVGLPTALLLLGAFYFVRTPVLDLMPFEIFSPETRIAPRRSIMVFTLWSIISALIGLFTHLLWDKLTHSGSWTSSVGGLLPEMYIAGVSLARLPQHASSIVGLIIIGLWAYRRFKSGAWKARKLGLPHTKKLQRAMLVFSILAVSVVLSFIVLFRAISTDPTLSLEHMLVSLITSTGLHLAACVVLYAVIHRISGLVKN